MLGPSILTRCTPLNRSWRSFLVSPIFKASQDKARREGGWCGSRGMHVERTTARHRMSARHISTVTQAGSIRVAAEGSGSIAGEIVHCGRSAAAYTCESSQLRTVASRTRLARTGSSSVIPPRPPHPRPPQRLCARRGGACVGGGCGRAVCEQARGGGQSAAATAACTGFRSCTELHVATVDYQPGRECVLRSIGSAADGWVRAAPAGRSCCAGPHARQSRLRQPRSVAGQNPS